MGLLHLDARTVTGQALGDNLDWWERSDARRIARERLQELDGVDPGHVIMGPDAARAAGLSSALVFPLGNLAPEGAVIKATSIDPGVVDADNVYRHTGRARVFATERDAVRAIKARGDGAVVAGDIVVLAGCGPAGTGMEETYQLTSALKHLPWGKHVAVITDARFSGVSTGACIGHVGPEALVGGPIGRLRDGDVIRIQIDRTRLEGRIDFIGGDADTPLDPAAAAALLAGRDIHPAIAAHPRLPADTRLWAALQEVSGGTWAGCVYDVDRIVETLRAGREALAQHARDAGRSA
jgi:dihydroxyacid dehydratase/phosphogluconate dehydratase